MYFSNIYTKGIYNNDIQNRTNKRIPKENHFLLNNKFELNIRNLLIFFFYFIFITMNPTKPLSAKELNRKVEELEVKKKQFEIEVARVEIQINIVKLEIEKLKLNQPQFVKDKIKSSS